MGKLINTERVLEGNLCNLCIVLMSQFDSDMKDQVENMSKYSGLKKKMDSTVCMTLIKKMIYTSGTEDLHTRHNKMILYKNIWHAL